MAVRTKPVKAGEWRTLEVLWDTTATAFFRAPTGSEIRIRYNSGWFGWERQKQILNGISTKRLVVSKWSIFGAKIQIRTQKDIDVTYDLEPGKTALIPLGIFI